MSALYRQPRRRRRRDPVVRDRHLEGSLHWSTVPVASMIEPMPRSVTENFAFLKKSTTDCRPVVMNRLANSAGVRIVVELRRGRIVEVVQEGIERVLILHFEGDGEHHRLLWVGRPDPRAGRPRKGLRPRRSRHAKRREAGSGNPIAPAPVDRSVVSAWRRRPRVARSMRLAISRLVKRIPARRPCSSFLINVLPPHLSPFARAFSHTRCVMSRRGSHSRTEPPFPVVAGFSLLLCRRRNSRVRVSSDVR